MQYPVTVARIFLHAAICMTQRRISRTPASVNVTLLVRRRKRGWTRGRRWVTRAQWVDTCVCRVERAAAKRQDTGKQCEHTLHRPLCVHHPRLLPCLSAFRCLFLLAFPLFFVKLQLVSHLFSVIFGVLFHRCSTVFFYHLRVGGQHLNSNLDGERIISIHSLSPFKFSNYQLVFATFVDSWFYFYYKFLRFCSNSITTFPAFGYIKTFNWWSHQSYSLDVILIIPSQLNRPNLLVINWQLIDVLAINKDDLKIWKFNR